MGELAVVRCKLHPSEAQAVKLTEAISLCNRFYTSLQPLGTENDTKKSLEVKCDSLFGRAIGSADYINASSNSLQVVLHTYVLRWMKGERDFEEMRGVPFYGSLERMAPNLNLCHVPLVGDIPIDKEDVTGTVRYTYIYKQANGQWWVAFVLGKLGKDTEQPKKKFKGAWF